LSDTPAEYGGGTWFQYIYIYIRFVGDMVAFVIHWDTYTGFIYSERGLSVEVWEV
jgi:hypothetical protein